MFLIALQNTKLTTTPHKLKYSLMSSLLWTERFRPATLKELVGNPGPICALQRYVNTRDHHTSPLLLSGPPGVGKTSAAIAALKDAGYSILELNASDIRTPSALLQEIEPLMATGKTLLAKKRFGIIIDEMDGATPAAAAAIASLYNEISDGKPKKKKQKRAAVTRPPLLPVIAICNDSSSTAVRTISKVAVQHIKFEPLEPRDMHARLKQVVVAAGASGCIAKKTLRDMLSACSGDLRAFITTAQMVCANGVRDGGSKDDGRGNTVTAKDAEVATDTFGRTRMFLASVAKGDLTEAERICGADGGYQMLAMLSENGLKIVDNNLATAALHLNRIAEADVMFSSAVPSEYAVHAVTHCLPGRVQPFASSMSLQLPRTWQKGHGFMGA